METLVVARVPLDAVHIWSAPVQNDTVSSESTAVKKKRVSSRKKPRRKVARRRANPDGRELIGNFAEKLYYKGGKGKPPSTRWVHKFEDAVKVWGLPDGSVLLEPVNPDISIWDMYDVKVK